MAVEGWQQWQLSTIVPVSHVAFLENELPSPLLKNTSAGAKCSSTTSSSGCQSFGICDTFNLRASFATLVFRRAIQVAGSY